ncbi:MAG: N-acetylmuramidase family protein [Muribaculaceae bacterium]|nr:N-acetylmuramidase family protein [Muribaculaceae bacterium]
MKKLLFIPFFVVSVVVAFTGFACNNSTTDSSSCDTSIAVDSTIIPDSSLSDSSAKTNDTTYSDAKLTQKDYDEVAARLGVEPAAIRAVVEIEAGRANKGFWAPGKPLINFDMSIVNKFASKCGVKLSKYRSSHPEIWGASKKKYGSQQGAEWARFEALRSVDNTLGIYSSFWGMFQIGGFNWKLCKTKDVNEFFRLMSRSERDQLELFANFIVSSNLLKYLKAKNWAGFASRYNGPSYAKRGYHTRMARAYAKYKNQK